MNRRRTSFARLIGCALALVPARAVAQVAAPPQPEPQAPAPDAAHAEPSGSKVPELDLLTFYKDNYFLTGFTAATEVKFQFSAKFDIWPNRTAHAVYFAFSQKSLWNIYQSSQPFVENNYAPELFYTYFHAPGRYDPKAGCGFFLERLGLVHESNGENGARSRGWNRAYGESRFACYNEARNYADVTLQVWAPPFGIADNPHITRYEGYGELSMSVGSDQGHGWLGDWDLTVHGRKGTLRQLRVGSVEVDARWRPRYGDFWRFTPYLYGQLFTGYAETMLSFDHSLSAVRVGIGFTDRSTRSE